MGIQLSEIAATRVQHFLTNRGKGIGLRLAVKTTGCSGLAYVIEFVDELQEDDEVFETNGVKVVIDKKSLVFLEKGLTKVSSSKTPMPRMPAVAAKALLSDQRLRCLTCCPLISIEIISSYSICSRATS